jgi:hypothetical protein
MKRWALLLVVLISLPLSPVWAQSDEQMTTVAELDGERISLQDFERGFGRAVG